jgi:hypothetical protein
MLYDLMPVWLKSLLQMDKALLPTNEWTWRHICRYGRDPAKTVDDYERYMRRTTLREKDKSYGLQHLRRLADLFRDLYDHHSIATCNRDIAFPRLASQSSAKEGEDNVASTSSG